MKVGIAAKSSFTFERVKLEFSNDEKLNALEIYQTNILGNYEFLEAIDDHVFAVILDHKLSAAAFDQIKKTATEKRVPLLIFYGNWARLIEDSRKYILPLYKPVKKNKVEKIKTVFIRPKGKEEAATKDKSISTRLHSLFEKKKTDKPIKKKIEKASAPKKEYVQKEPEPIQKESSVDPEVPKSHTRSTNEQEQKAHEEQTRQEHRARNFHREDQSQQVTPAVDIEIIKENDDSQTDEEIKENQSFSEKAFKVLHKVGEGAGLTLYYTVRGTMITAGTVKNAYQNHQEVKKKKLESDIILNEQKKKWFKQLERERIIEQKKTQKEASLQDRYALALSKSRANPIKRRSFRQKVTRIIFLFSLIIMIFYFFKHPDQYHHIIKNVMGFIKNHFS